jgi:hypothetical protein
VAGGIIVWKRNGGKATMSAVTFIETTFQQLTDEAGVGVYHFTDGKRSRIKRDNRPPRRRAAGEVEIRSIYGRLR